MVDIVKDWNGEFWWVGKRDHPDVAEAIGLVDEEYGLDDLYNGFDKEPVYVTVAETRLRGCVCAYSEDEGFHWHPDPDFKYGTPVWEIQTVTQDWAETAR